MAKITAQVPWFWRRKGDLVAVDLQDLSALLLKAADQLWTTAPESIAPRIEATLALNK